MCPSPSGEWSKRARNRQSPEERSAALRDEEITESLRQEQRRKRNDIKIVFFGPSGCGKSTFINAVRLAHTKDALSEDYRKSRRSAIFTSVIETMRNMIHELDDRDLLPQDEGLDPHILTVLEATTPYEQVPLDAKLTSALGHLWSKEILKVRGYNMVESQGVLIEYAALHYLNDLSRISSDDYVPSLEDVVRLHSPTKGIEETVIELGASEKTLRLFEVGHMVSDRRKWLPYMSDVDAIAFMVPISLYDHEANSGEGTGSNPIQEALQDFASLIQLHEKWLGSTPILLLLNGMDKFKEKVPLKPLKNAFPDFQGSDEFKAAASFILDSFLDQTNDKDQRRTIFSFFTSALDQPHVRLTLACIMDIFAVNSYIVCKGF